ncbi:hypothetical protein ACFX2G_002182 [Malus domestica]
MSDKLGEYAITTTIPFEQSLQSASGSGEAKAKLNESYRKYFWNLMEMKKKGSLQIASRLYENDLPWDLKEKIMTFALYELRANENIDIKNIHPILPWKYLIDAKRHLCLNTLKRVSMLQNVNEKEFEAFCEDLINP